MNLQEQISRMQSMMGINESKFLLKESAIDDESILKVRKSLDDVNPGLNNVSNSSGPQSYLDNLSKTELESRLGSYSWKNIGYNQELMSGWKFHVFGEDLKDAVYLQDALKPVIDKYRCSAKIGGTYQNSADSFKPGQVQHGKQGATIYIPPDVINNGNQKEMLTDIQNAISGYKKGGTISGDQFITPSIHYRYELSGPIPKGGIDMNSYSKMYSKNDGGSYKPSDVDDLFETSTTGTIKSVPKIENGFLATKFGNTSNVNWEVIANAKNMSDYDVFIDDAFKTGNFSKISRSGFEDYGIPNFREYLMNIYNKQEEMKEQIDRVKNWKQFLNENLSEYQLNNILDKIHEFGIDSLSNHEKTLLKSYSDKSIDVKKEIEKHINKYQTSKNIIKTIPLQVDDEELEKNIGRYIRFKKQKEWRKLGLLVNMGMIFEIVAIQKHWGHVDGKYVPNKIGYRVAEVGEERDFGRVGDIDEIDFVNLTEDEATKINKEIHSNFENGIFPKWYYKS